MSGDSYLCWQCFRASCSPCPQVHDRRASLASDRCCCFHTAQYVSFQRPVPAGLLPRGVILLCSRSGTESGWVHLAPRAVTLPRTKILLGSCQVLQWILSSWSPAFAGDWKGRERRKRTKNKPNKQDALPVFPNTQPRMPDLRLGPQYLVLTNTPSPQGVTQSPSLG